MERLVWRESTAWQGWHGLGLTPIGIAEMARARELGIARLGGSGYAYLHVPESACSSSKSRGVPESMRTAGRAQRDACSGPPYRGEPVANRGNASIFPFKFRRDGEDANTARALTRPDVAALSPRGVSVWFA